jgi:hypothetical protein
MLCEACKKEPATVHLTTASKPEVTGERTFHFCEACAKAIVPLMPELPPQLLCLSDLYRSRLYDALQSSHPEAFYTREDPKLRRKATNAMETFLREQLRKDKIDIGDFAFQMLLHDFSFSRHFYERRDLYHRMHPRIAEH